METVSISSASASAPSAQRPRGKWYFNFHRCVERQGEVVARFGLGDKSLSRRNNSSVTFQFRQTRLVKSCATKLLCSYIATSHLPIWPSIHLRLRPFEGGGIGIREMIRLLSIYVFLPFFIFFVVCFKFEKKKLSSWGVIGSRKVLLRITCAWNATRNLSSIFFLLQRISFIQQTKILRDASKNISL